MRIRETIWRALLSAALLLAGTSVRAQVPSAPAGEGTAESPYQITQLGHLVWMGERASESAGKHYRLLNDIDAAAEGQWRFEYGYEGFRLQDGFAPIGNDFAGRFCGTFDGQGHLIRGLYVAPYDSDAGLFGIIGEGGRVQNLALVGAYVEGVRIGGVAGVCYGGVISNCAVSAVLHGATVGGIVGYFDSGAVVRCAATGWFGSDWGVRAGGLVGEAWRPEASVSECYAAARLQAGDVGGLVTSAGEAVIATIAYWDAELSGVGASARGGEGKTSAQMRRAATFVGWDFTNLWGIVEGASMPYLRALPLPFTLNVITQGAGRIEIAPQKTSYQPGERVTLTAYSDAPGYVFSHWLGGESNLLTTVTTVTMDNPRTLLAVFEPATDIATVEELQAMGGAANYRLAQDIDAWATTNWNDGAGFAPIGDFSGIFDGNGHVIRGLTIKRPTQDGVGLFRYCESALLRRLGLDGGSIKGGSNVGALAGFVGAGIFEECFGTGDVGFTGFGAGGLIGSSWSDGPVGLLVKCYSTANVSASSTDPQSTLYVGGLVGVLNHMALADCYAMGNVTGLDSVGGLIGSSSDQGTVVRCFATGHVTGQIAVGGLIGQGSDYFLRQCYATGAAKGELDVGCLIGYGHGGSSTLGENGVWITGLSEAYAVGRLDRVIPNGVLVGHYSNDWFPAAYWDVDTTWADSLYVPLGRRTAQMKRMANYAGWDFTNTWAIVEGVSYPYLRGVGTPFLLHVVAEGPGRVVVSPQRAFYAPGEVVTLTAVPDTAVNLLARWVGLVTDEDAAVTTVTMDIHKTVTAVFVTPRGIASVEDLQKIGVDPAYPADGSYRLTQDIDASDTTHWNEGAGFVPLAQGLWPGFDGLIDGQGHVIKGLTINRPGETYVGLVGSLGLGGVLRNIGLSECSVIGGNEVGGLVGGNRVGRVARSFVQGSVGGGGELGGLVGHNEGVVAKCYMSGTVAAAAGGVVGRQCWGGRIYETYASAAGAGGTAAGGLVGSVAPYAYGVVTQSYWDVDVSGCEVSAGGEGRVTAEMMRQATYAGWDFSSEWGIDEGAGYPFLWRFRLGLPEGLGVTTGAGKPAYAVWAASRTNAWGTADFCGVPLQDFETAWLLDERPAVGVAEAVDCEVAAFEVGAAEIRVTLALNVSGAAKQGSVNGWLVVEGRAGLAEAWETVAGQQAGNGRIAFADGLATVVFSRPEGFRFFLPVLLPACPAVAVAVRQDTP